MRPVTLLLRAAAAAVAACAAVAGAGLVPPASAAPGDLVITGHGWGHGRGMGQWGALGYAVDQGWDHPRILDHYYGGTTASTSPVRSVSVRLTAMDGRDLLVTSGAPFSVGGIVVSAGSAARLTRTPAGTYELYTRYGCGQPDAWYAGVVDPTVVSSAPPGDDVRTMLHVCQPDGVVRAYRGTLSLAYGDGAQRTVNVLDVEQYLRGVVPHESSPAWADLGSGRGAAALRAQAVAARSYALAEGGESGQRWAYAKTCDTTACQVYRGAGTATTRTEDRRTDAAIAATAGVVRRHGDGRLARTEFSASTGGWTAGGTFPAVRDDGDTRSPYHDWSTEVSPAAVASAFGVGVLQSVEVVRRNGLGADGGRVLDVRVTGTSATRTVTGAAFRSALGLRSDWFKVGVPPDQVLQWHQRSTVTTGVADASFRFGRAGSQSVACDWGGAGVDAPAVFRDGEWWLRSVNSTGFVQVLAYYGDRGDVPLCGDWDGDGRPGIGVYRPSTGWFHLRQTPTSGVADVSFPYGDLGDRPVVGDWDGDGTTTVGVRRPADVTFYLRNANSAGVAHGAIAFGDRTDVPVTGSWTGSRFTTIGVVRDGSWYLRTSNFPGGSHDLLIGFGGPGDRPVTGDWDADGTTEPGITREVP